MCTASVLLSELFAFKQLNQHHLFFLRYKSSCLFHTILKLFFTTCGVLDATTGKQKNFPRRMNNILQEGCAQCRKL